MLFENSIMVNKLLMSMIICFEGVTENPQSSDGRRELNGKKNNENGDIDDEEWCQWWWPVLI